MEGRNDVIIFSLKSFLKIREKRVGDSQFRGPEKTLFLELAEFEKKNCKASEDVRHERNFWVKFSNCGK